MASIHETAEGLHDVGVMDKQTMRKFDEACLTPGAPADGCGDPRAAGAGRRRLWETQSSKRP
jgi:hypothetical protein